jgi:hypothetical protein
MLETLPRLNHSEIVMRLAIPRDDVRALEALELDRGNIVEMLELLKRRGSPGGLERLIDASFEPWNKFGPPFGYATRFSNGNWPVCYTARDRHTAEDEIKYHRGKDLLTIGSLRRFFSRLIILQYSGTTIDLFPQKEIWLELTSFDESSAYPFCQELGREATATGIAGFLTPSARREEGTNLPVFQRGALSSPEVRGVVAFSVNPAEGTVDIAWG